MLSRYEKNNEQFSQKAQENKTRGNKIETDLVLKVKSIKGGLDGKLRC